MSGLLDSRGNPLEYKKTPAPPLGEKFGVWSGVPDIIRLPGGGALIFDLDNLRLSDFRQMRDHYQINASLSVLTFMLHQLSWHIECENSKIADQNGENLLDVWTRLVRAQSQSFWAGYSPNVLQWENDVNNRQVVLTKIKDLVPETCEVHWKKVDGKTATPPQGITPQIRIFDGIKQIGWPEPYPPGIAYWYPLLMENGNYYGRKILRAAFVPWFFSNLMHLYSNRYFERFGEPIPVGRAPFDEEIDIAGNKVRGNIAMQQVITQLRNRSTVVLPNQKTPIGMNDNDPDYDYTLEYLESQMRGADFERYITRLDEEITLGLFTPLLITRTADVGSYNLGVGHLQTYQWMLNAIAADWAEYIDKYILSPMTDYNFGPNAPRPKIKFRQLGKESAETMRAVIQQLLSNGTVGVDLTELGEMVGLKLHEVKQITDANPDGPDNPADPADRRREGPRGTDEPRATTKDISARIRPQVEKAFRNKKFGKDFEPVFGFERRFEESLRVNGYTDPTKMKDDFYRALESWTREVVDLGQEEFGNPDNFMNIFDKFMDNTLNDLVAS